ncbi:MAG: isoprenylcysteine carboxylmethyltransferase family protein [Actinobacteria bacterium]|nr:isoprenylcysteine carboxylmethyltransferase family protein [Actinomycetota bacterium]
MTSSLPKLGRRGEGWVALQVVLLVVMLAAGTKGRKWPSASRGMRMAAASLSGLCGLYLFGDGVARLGRQITPFPKPVEEGSVKNTGAYGLVRHPMYGGVLLMTLAWSLASAPLALMPWTVAVGFLDAKRRREEAWLVEEYPGYEEYQTSVRHSLVPFVW